MQLRAVRSVPFFMSNAEILPHEVSIAIGIVASVYVLWCVVQLVTVEMLSTRVAFAAALLLTFEFLLRVWFRDTPSLLRMLVGL